MIRVILSTVTLKAYGYDVTNWENKESNYYDNLLAEDLVDRSNEGDILMYFPTKEDAEEFFMKFNSFKYELLNFD